jgi:predicted 2-oxoglutarate/Fe(II)-dependent dioxygenase YbiX
MKKGVFLHDVYKNMEFSNIYKLSRKLFTAGISQAQSENPFLAYLKHKNADSTLINYYTNKSFYSHHQDDSIITAVTALWKFPRAFTGGDLKFTDYDYTTNLTNNSVIIFPGFVEHEVTQIEMDNQQRGFGRYSITQFMTIM